MSDLHADHYCYDTSGITKMDRQIDEFFRLSGISKIPADERYMFIIPGDLSNSNTVAKVFLLRLKELFKYVILVPGNHDLYSTQLLPQGNMMKDKVTYDYSKDDNTIKLNEWCRKKHGRISNLARKMWPNQKYPKMSMTPLLNGNK